MLPIYVVISTIDDGIGRVEHVLLPRLTDVHYVVSWQRTQTALAETAASAIAELRQRSDVTVTELEGRGLCRNRNHGIETAVGLMSDPLADAIIVLADDDETFLPDAFERMRKSYSQLPRLDIALLRASSSEDGRPLKPYLPYPVAYGEHPRSYYPMSVEMTMRSRVWHAGLRFDERFGLGSEVLCAGEEDVFLHDAQRRGLNVWLLPIELCRTNPLTTGSRQLDPVVLRSKGAVYGYTRNLCMAWLRGLREALSLGVRRRTNPFTLFRHILRGINYIRI